MKKRLFVLLVCLFVVNIGFGITLPVLPFYTERLALAEGASSGSVGMHVGLLTAVYAFMQLIFAPLWGSLSDRVGRKPLLLAGIAGYAVAQALFGVASSLWLLYAARMVGGVLSSATLPAASAYVADRTGPENRNRGMAWLGTAASLGVVVGPAFGGTLARRDWHFSAQFGHFVIDSFSVPFFAASLLALLTLFIALRWIPESLPARARSAGSETVKSRWRDLGRRLRPLLVLAFIGQFGLALFEAIFALFASIRFNYGPLEVGAIFIVCGAVMAVFQTVLAGYLTARIAEKRQIAAGFVLMGASLVLLAAAGTTVTVFGLVGLMAFGMALIAPNLSALISKRSDASNVGAALGVQNMANNLGQVGGPVLGGALFALSTEMPFFLTGSLLVATGLIVARYGMASSVDASFGGRTGEREEAL